MTLRAHHSESNLSVLLGSLPVRHLFILQNIPFMVTGHDEEKGLTEAVCLTEACRPLDKWNSHTLVVPAEGELNYWEKV